MNKRLAQRNEGNMARYAVDLRDRVIRRVTQEYNGVDNKRFFLIEGVAGTAWGRRWHQTIGHLPIGVGRLIVIGGACEKCLLYQLHHSDLSLLVNQTLTFEIWI